MKHNYWKVDPCQEAGGGWTVRVDNETEFGDINRDPVATFNDLDDAELCVKAQRVFVDLMEERE